jgi:hypothetical protein
VTVGIADMRAHRRKQFIRLSRKLQKPGAGSSCKFLRRRTASMIWFDPSETLSPVLFAVVGGVATRLYMPERMTRDLAIVIAASDATTAQARLRAGGFRLAGNLSLVRGTTRVGADGQEDDLEGLIQLGKLEME